MTTKAPKTTPTRKKGDSLKPIITRKQAPALREIARSINAADHTPEVVHAAGLIARLADWLESAQRAEQTRKRSDATAAHRKAKALKTANLLYAVEFTDTFAGEANYCWVERFTVRAANIKQAITKAKQHRYYSPIPAHTASDYGDQVRIDIKGESVCAFITYIDPEEHDTDKHGEIIN